MISKQYIEEKDYIKKQRKTSLNKFIYRTVFTKPVLEPLTNEQNVTQINNLDRSLSADEDILDTKINALKEKLANTYKSIDVDLANSKSALSDLDVKRERLKWPHDKTLQEETLVISQDTFDTNIKESKQVRFASSDKGKQKEVSDTAETVSNNTAIESPSGSSSTCFNTQQPEIITDTMTPVTPSQFAQLPPDAQRFTQGVNQLAALGVEVTGRNLQTHNINLQRTEEQTQRYENLTTRYIDYMRMVGNSRTAWYIGGATVIGALGWYIVRYQQLPFQSVFSRMLGGAATGGSSSIINAVPNMGNVSVNITLPPSPIPIPTMPPIPTGTNITIPSIVADNFPTISAMLPIFISGVLLALRFKK
jgi:hypothetical protein